MNSNENINWREIAAASSYEGTLVNFFFLKDRFLIKTEKFSDNLVNYLIQDSAHSLMMLKKIVIAK